MQAVARALPAGAHVAAWVRATDGQGVGRISAGPGLATLLWPELAQARVRAAARLLAPCGLALRRPLPAPTALPSARLLLVATDGTWPLVLEGYNLSAPATACVRARVAAGGLRLPTATSLLWAAVQGDRRAGLTFGVAMTLLFVGAYLVRTANAGERAGAWAPRTAREAIESAVALESHELVHQHAAI